MADVGILNRLSLLSPKAFGEGSRLFTEFKGALTETFILQSLIPQFEVSPRYWTDNIYEVDFVIQHENDVFPIEVKAEKNTKCKSLLKFKEKYSENVKLRVRFSFDNLILDGDLLNIPLFMVDYSKKLITMALRKNRNF